MAERLATRNPWIAGLRIMRPGNIAMMVIGCVAVRHGLIEPWGEPHRSGTNAWIATVTLALLGAGGNVINDYFDLKEDRINKPRYAFVGTVLRRRDALALHLGLTAAGLGLAGWLAFREGNGWVGVFAVGMALLLGLYSPVFKRGFLRGNVAIALAVGALPVWVAFGPDAARPEVGAGISLYAGLSAWITGLREVVKDLQDRAGDAAFGYTTLPVVWGEVRTWRLLQRTMAMTWIPLVAVAWHTLDRGGWWAAYLLPFALAHRAVIREDKRAASAWLKAALGGGLLAVAFGAG
jgi:4-hydroxybenzoate polyprenyltransferase